MQTHTHHRSVLACRQDTLDKFAVLQVQFNNLQEQLRGILKLYVAHPKALLSPSLHILHPDLDELWNPTQS